MRKKTRTPTRKRTALRRCAVLALLLCVTSALNLYHPLPIQAVRGMADIEDVEHPRVIERFYDGSLPITRFALHYLVDGDNSMMLCVAGWHAVLGWYDRAYASVETWDGTGLYAGMYAHYQDDKRVGYLFGQIDDDEITQLLVEVHSSPQPEEAEVYFIDIPRENIFEKDGKRYFLSKMNMEELPDWLYDVHVSGIDEDGNIVQTTETMSRSWST